MLNEPFVIRMVPMLLFVPPLPPCQMRCARLEKVFEIRSRSEWPGMSASGFATKFAAVESALVQLGAGQWHRSTELNKEMGSKFRYIACTNRAGAKRTPMPEDMDLARAAPGVYLRREKNMGKGQPAWWVAIKQ